MTNRKKETDATLKDVEVAINAVSSVIKSCDETHSPLPNQDHIAEDLAKIQKISAKAVRKLIGKGKKSTVYSAKAYEAIEDIVKATRVLAEEADLVDRPKALTRRRM